MGDVVKNWDGKHYEQHSNHQKEWGNAVIQGLELSGSERILDLGCGNGYITRELALLVPKGEVLGIDFSSEMLAIGREKCLPNMKLEQLDINEISWENEFDVVFSNASLHWIHDHNRLVHNIFRALKHDGYMRVQFAADGNCSNLFAVIRKIMAEDRFYCELKEFKWPWFFPTEGEYLELITSVPFVYHQVWIGNNDRFFKTKDEIVGWIDNPSLIPFMQVLSPGIQREFRDRVVNEMLSLTRQEDGTYFETFRRMNVCAKK